MLIKEVDTFSAIISEKIMKSIQKVKSAKLRVLFFGLHLQFSQIIVFSAQKKTIHKMKP